MLNKLIYDLQKTRQPRDVGPKAANLQWLISRGYTVPHTYVCGYDVHGAFTSNNQQTLNALRQQLTKIIKPDRSYVVRSAANVEDTQLYSFAGQFTSMLEVQGVDAILDAMASVYRAIDETSVKAYLTQTGLSHSGLEMSVIIQEYVPPTLSGVAFSKNPLTGLNELIIEAVAGRGDLLLQGGISPLRWVHKLGDWWESPEVPETEQTIINHVMAQTREIAQAYHAPVDLEWVASGTQVYWVQLREITGLKAINRYSRRIAGDMLPGVIDPLVWSVNIPLVNTAWVDILTELIGPNDIDPLTLARAFHYRAYFNMGAMGQVFNALGFPAESLELLMGLDERRSGRSYFRPTVKTLRHIPRMVRFLFKMGFFKRKIENDLPGIQQAITAHHADSLAVLSEADLLAEFDRLYPLVQQVAYFNIIVPLLMMGYDRMLRYILDRRGYDYDLFDLTAGMLEIDRLDPNRQLANLSGYLLALDEEAQAQIKSSTYEEFRQMPGLADLQRGVESFIADFGHLSDSGTDFTSVPWRENPDIVLKILVNFPRGHKDQHRVSWEALDLPRLLRFRITPLYRRARDFRMYREMVSSLYTYSYGQFRPLFLALGERLAARGIIDHPKDIFYLYLDEIRECVHNGSNASLGPTTAKRKEEMQFSEGLTLPEVIYGDDVPLADYSHDGANTMRGIPTSRGYYTGTARVIHSLQEFDRLSEGEVLIVHHSDVSWTPLFSKAGAIIAESGGILSHSSIVAREFNLPAVVSVNGACQLPDGLLVTVDGFKGEVILHREDAS